MRSPYGAIADVRMLNFFRDLGETAAIVLGLLVVASVLVQNFWCRYLCPYGALLGRTSVLSPLRIRRSVPACIDCAKCAKAGPSALPVDKLITIKSAECTGCMECVAVCPSEGALHLALPRWTRSPKRWPPAFVGNGCGNRNAAVRNCRIRQDDGPLERRFAGLDLSPARAAGERCESPSRINVDRRQHDCLVGQDELGWAHEYSLMGATTRVIVPPGLGWSGLRPFCMDANRPINWLSITSSTGR